MVKRAGPPMYQQIADDLRAQIVGGAYQPGQQLPSESALRDQWQVSERTIRVAIDQLRAEGLVTSRHGLGHFVRQQPVPRRMSSDIDAGSGFHTTVQRQGLRQANVTTVRREPASADVAEWLGIAVGDEVVIRDRIIRTEGELPAGLATSYFPLFVVEAAPQLEDPTVPGLPVHLRQAFGPTYSRDVVNTRMPTPTEQQRLVLEPGTPVLTIKGGTYDQQRRPLHFIDKISAAGRIEYQYTFGAVPQDDEGLN
jgi:GntR family transcriptional regulator